MASIYQNALVTVAGLLSPGSNHGILSQRIKDTTEVGTKCHVDLVISTEPSISGRTVRATVMRDWELESLHSMLMNSTPLTSRGWCLQEDVLSPRVLYYGKQNMYWKCLNGYTSSYANTVEYGDFDAGLAALLSHNKIPSLLQESRTDYILSQYYELVQQYSRRQLTIASDKLPAFSGLARVFHSLLGGDYLAGLWTSDLHTGLGWAAALYVAGPEGDTPAHSYRAPSWSWAAITTRVDFEYCKPEDGRSSESILQVLTSHMEYKDPVNPYGELKSCILHVQGLTSELRCSTSKSRQVGTFVHGLSSWDRYYVPTREFQWDTLVTEVKEGSSGEQFYSVGGLVPSGEGEGREEYFDHPGLEFERRYTILLVSFMMARKGEMRQKKQGRYVCLVLESSHGTDNIFKRLGRLTLGPETDLKGWAYRSLQLI